MCKIAGRLRDFSTWPEQNIRILNWSELYEERRQDQKVCFHTSQPVCCLNTSSRRGKVLGSIRWILQQTDSGKTSRHSTCGGGLALSVLTGLVGKRAGGSCVTLVQPLVCDRSETGSRGFLQVLQGVQQYGKICRTNMRKSFGRAVSTALNPPHFDSVDVEGGISA